MNEIVQPAAENITVPTSEVPEVEAIEKEARRRGWRPKDEYDGDPEKWRPAEKFVEVGNNIKEARNNEVMELRNAVLFLTRKTLEREEEIRSKVLQELKEQKVEAIRAGDEVKVEQIEQEIDVHKKKVQEVKNYDPEQAQIDEWNKRNSYWANDLTPENKKMRNRANLYYTEYMEDNPGSTKMAAILHAEERIAKDFPEKFNREPPTTTRRSNTVETSQQNPTVKSTNPNKIYSIDDLNLSPSEKASMRVVIKAVAKTNKNYTEDFYVKKLIDQKLVTVK